MVSAILLFLLAQTQPAPPRPACTAPEHRQFDFWVGEWDVRNPAGQQLGVNRIERVEGGCGLQENWASSRGAYTGRSINAYRPETRQWHQTWLGNDGGLLLLDGKYADGKMVLEGKSVGADGKPLLNRITWSKLDGGGVRQLWEQSADEGKTWSTAFDGLYSHHQKKGAGDACR
jgi:hypothetical protein